MQRTFQRFAGVTGVGAMRTNSMLFIGTLGCNSPRLGRVGSARREGTRCAALRGKNCENCIVMRGRI